MDHSIPSHLIDAYQKCHGLAFGHYENFPVASLLLPKNSRPHVAALYAFARIADDYADEPPEPQEKIGEGLSPIERKKAVQRWSFKLLNQWDQQFKKALSEKPAPPILQAFAHTVKVFQIPPSLPLALLKAFRMDVSGRRYGTWKSVLNYCQNSANPVGRMVLLIHGYRDEKLHRYSDFICSGLQLINFWQDSAVDLKKNRIYYPREELKLVGVHPEALLALQYSPQVRQLIKNAVDFTENYFHQGYPLLDSVEGRLRLELRATCLGGQGILNKIRRMDYNVLQNRPALSAFDKISAAVRSLFGSVQP